MFFLNQDRIIVYPVAVFPRCFQNHSYSANEVDNCFFIFHLIKIKRWGFIFLIIRADVKNITGGWKKIWCHRCCLNQNFQNLRICKVTSPPSPSPSFCLFYNSENSDSHRKYSMLQPSIRAFENLIMHRLYSPINRLFTFKTAKKRLKPAAAAIRSGVHKKVLIIFDEEVGKSVILW